MFTPPISLLKNQRLYWGLSYASGYFHLGMLNQAKKELIELGIQYQSIPEVLSLRGLILMSEKSWEALIQQSLFASYLYPKVPEFYIQAAYALDKMKEHTRALDLWLKAPISVRTSPLYHYNVARCQASLGKMDRASEYIKAALLLDPKMIHTIRKDPKLKSCLAS